MFGKDGIKMAQNNGNKKKKGNLYYAIIALFLILSGALGTSQQDGTVIENNTGVAVESQMGENETTEDTLSDGENANNFANVDSEETVNAGENADAEEENNADTEQNNVSEEQREEVEEETVEITYTFRKKSNLDSHYEKHGIEMGFESAEEYLAAANKVLTNPNTLHKIEKEDGDDVYYLEETNEFVVVSTDGYIRTYFNPSGGMDYFNRQ